METLQRDAEEKVYMDMMQEQDDYQNRAEDIQQLILEEQAFNREFGQPDTNQIPFEYVESAAG